MQKENGFKQSFSNRKFKMGGFQTLTMVIVIIVVIILNLIVGKMNITVDLSSDKIYSVTEDTRKMVNGLSDDITIYHLVQDGNEDVAIEKVLEEYEKLDHVSIEKKDPVIYPNFAKEYTDEEVTDNSVIVVDAAREKSKYIPYADMVIQDMDYEAYYTTGSQSYTNTLDAEGQITAAIQTVTSDNSKKIYYTTGHGEQELDAAFSDIMKKSNIDSAKLDSLDKVPEDCDILLMNGPQYDLNEDEYKVVYAYMQGGGKAMFFLNALAEKQPNLKKLMKDYGVNVADGYLLDTAPSDSSKLTTELLVTANDHDITADVGEKGTYMAQTMGMTTEKDVRSTLTVESLLDTEDSAFCRTDMQESAAEKVDSDVNGPFSVAVAATDTYTENTEGEGHASRMIVYGSYLFANEVFVSTDQFGNRSMLLNSITWLTGSETSTLAIPTRSLDSQRVQIEGQSQMLWTVLLVVIIPVALLAAGIVIWYRRRKN